MMRLVIDPHLKETNHLKIVLNLDGTLEKVQLYHDGSAGTDEILSVYEELKEEIIVFGVKAQELMKVYYSDEGRKEGVSVGG